VVTTFLMIQVLIALLRSFVRAFLNAVWVCRLAVQQPPVRMSALAATGNAVGVGSFSASVEH
jgi:hypothetical protein